MEIESIKELLTTVRNFNTVNIDQVFSKDDTDWIRVRSVPSTSTLELTFLQDQRVEHYESIAEAADVIHMHINSP